LGVFARRKFRTEEQSEECADHGPPLTDTAARNAGSARTPPLRPDHNRPPPVSSVPIDALYTAESLNGFDPETDLGYPGQYPFARGVHASMYRSRLWTMRQFAGFGSPRDTNQRFKFLLEKGQDGLSTAFDLRRSWDSTATIHARSARLAGSDVAVDTLDDMADLYDGIDLEKVLVSMTINAPAAIVMAFYLANAQDRGFDWRQFCAAPSRTTSSRSFTPRTSFVFPPEPHVRLVADVIEFCAQHVPQWNSVSISGYHIREAGSTPRRSWPSRLADGFHYVDVCLARGLDV